MQVRKTQKNKQEALAAAQNGEVRLIETGRSQPSSATEFKQVLESYDAKLVKNEEEGYWAAYIPGEGYSVRTSKL